jgi:hypothetical protein
MELKYVLEHKVLWSLFLVSLLTAVAVAFFNPGSLAFRAFDVTEFVQSIMPLVMFALFIERVLEVFLTSWRSHRTAELKERAANARSKSSKHESRTPEEEAFRQYRSETQRIAFCAGTTLGVIVAALGIRVLELSVDPAAFATLPQVQQRLFRTTDVLMTGAVLGGGSDALPQLVMVFTNFFQSAAGRVKETETGRQA